jgi:N6-adenosine-specific RNA methylase IME4
VTGPHNLWAEALVEGQWARPENFAEQQYRVTNTNVTDKLAILTDVERQLARVRTVDEAKAIRDQAAAISMYCKVARKGLEIQNHACFIKIQAERRAGELLRESVKNGTRDRGGRGPIVESKRATQLKDLGISKSQSSQWQTMSRVSEARVQEIAAGATETGKELTSAAVYREGLLQKPATVSDMPAGVFRVVYADPPWSYDTGCFPLTQNGGGAQAHYPTMPLEDLCRMKLPQIAEDAVLFLWSPAPLLDKALRLIPAWGFTYKQNFTWWKLKHNWGHYNSAQHEHLLLATRGSCTPDSQKLEPSVVALERTEHSRKPEYFRTMIDGMYPIGNRIELFARGTLPKHWAGWGNEFKTEDAA